jgi:glycosyltransferase involved in cell wall biosynthesis
MASDPFGGSEELWTRTAALLAKQGMLVAASVHGWPQLDRRIRELAQAGVDLRPRPVKPSLIGRARRYMSGKAQMTFDIEQSFGNTSPSLVVISNGSVTSVEIELLEMCIARGWPFAILAHSNFSGWWPSDEMAVRYRKALPSARRFFFVSEANRSLAMKQFGYEIDNGEIVRNPVTIDVNSSIPWPTVAVEQELRMACVGNLFPTEKGQDILLEVLADPCWRERNWRLALYGNGRGRNVLERLVERLKLCDRVSFAGHVAGEKIWRENHILVMPSRYEGMPITIVEAMVCGRPIVATNVGGISELVEDGRTGFLAEAAAVECFSKAIERMWAQRDRLQDMGKLAAASIQEFLPHDPVEIFAEKLKAMASLQRNYNGSIGSISVHR